MSGGVVGGRHGVVNINITYFYKNSMHVIPLHVYLFIYPSVTKDIDVKNVLGEIITEITHFDGNASP